MGSRETHLGYNFNVIRLGSISSGTLVIRGWLIMFVDESQAWNEICAVTWKLNGVITMRPMGPSYTCIIGIPQICSWFSGSSKL